MFSEAVVKVDEYPNTRVVAIGVCGVVGPEAVKVLVGEFDGTQHGDRDVRDV